jgi:hypothetical protein
VSKFCGIIIFLLSINGLCYCMGSSDAPVYNLDDEQEAGKPFAQAEYILLDASEVYDDFLGEEFIEMIRTIVRLIYTLDSVSAEKTDLFRKDVAILRKRLLLVNMADKIRAATENMVDICLKLFELEKRNPVIATQLRIKQSFKVSFEERVRATIVGAAANLGLKRASIDLTKRLKEAKHLIDGISINIILSKNAEAHLKLFEELKSLIIKFLEDFGVSSFIVRSMHQQGLACKPYKRGRTRKLARRG